MKHRWIAAAIGVLAITNSLVIGFLAPAFGKAQQSTAYLHLGSQFRGLVESGAISVNEQRMHELVQAGALPEHVSEPDDLVWVLGRYQWEHPCEGYGESVGAANLTHSALLLGLATLLWSGGRERSA